MSKSPPASGLTNAQQAFLEKRRKVLSLWRYAGAFMLIIIFAFAAYLYVRVPMFINPFEAIERLQADSLPQPTLEIMAALFPLLFGGLLLLLVSLVLIIYAAVANEKRYLAIVDGLSARPD